MQTDPISYAGGPNLYAYVGNDPANWTDPLGLTCSDPRRVTTCPLQRQNSSNASNGGPDLGGLTTQGRSYSDVEGSTIGDDPEEYGALQVLGRYTGGRYYGYGGFTMGIGTAGGERGGGGSLAEQQAAYRDARNAASDAYLQIYWDKSIVPGFELWVAIEFGLGREALLSPNLRLAPFGNRGGVELPHYHRRGFDPNTGTTTPGQGIGRHRPWDTKSTDTSFWDRF